MKKEGKHSFWVILLNISLSFVFFATGVYVLLEKKLIVSGKYIGSLHHYNDLESILVASSHFLISIFILLYLSKNKVIKRGAEWLFIIAIVIFLGSSFANY
jgi:hypothetical protein